MTPAPPAGVLLSSVVLMWALDPSEHHDKILESIDQLTELDKLRQGYYRDLSEWHRLRTVLEVRDP